ncbi:hypothetical protein [Maricaulis sp.]|uniref:hypothetical protein n=1 Tax=Maricaulis sp. TaxID=1486257 RepID=UPI0026022F31|nr:hypothetical protein [Maricaulis sp.]
MTQQLALDLPGRVDFSVDSFIRGDANREAVTALERWRDWPAGAFALVGPPGSGKSHLAAIWAQQSGARMTTLHALESVLDQLEPGAALVVEDADRGGSETALFHAFNRAAEGDLPALLLSARLPPAQWGAELPDLVSRLRALPQVTLHEPDDDLLTQLIQKQLNDRHAPIKPGVIEYLLPRMERSVAAARTLVDLLDKRALVKRTPITRAVAREVLAELNPDAPDPGDGE